LRPPARGRISANPHANGGLLRKELELAGLSPIYRHPSENSRPQTYAPPTGHLLAHFPCRGDAP